MTLNLPETVASSQDLRALIADVRAYAKWFAHETIKQRVEAKQESPQPVVSQAAAELINDWAGKKQLTTKSLDELAETLQDLDAGAPQLTITLAAPAAGDVRRKLVAWCRDNVSPDVLVSFSFNSGILGGMVVRYGSHVYDWSFRRQIMANRSKFPEVLRHV